MLVTSLPIEKCVHTKTSHAIAPLIAPGSALKLHSSSGSERHDVERYVFEQFHAHHGAAIRNFMPLLLTMNDHGGYSAAVGMRPACGHDLFLEQYLPDTAEKMISKVTGRRVKREHFAEIGNLVATQRGASQFLFLIGAAVLHQAGFEWLIFTATSQVRKTVGKLGFKLHTLGYADPSMLDADGLSSWGSYYETRPQVVVGNLAAAMTVMTGRKSRTRIISVYQKHIVALAAMIRQRGLRYEQHSLAA